MVGRRRGGGHGGEELRVNVPSFFRCPISLDVMRSPVSLCTGVTYDRSSIQAWLDTGHNTCPATMQVLPSTDFVPNHTLHRLIRLWSSQSQSQSHSQSHSQPLPDPHTLLRAIPSSPDPLPSLRLLAEVAADPARLPDLAGNPGCLPALHGVLLRKGVDMGAQEAAVGVFSAVLRYRKEEAVPIGHETAADPRILPSLVAVLRLGSRLESRIAAAWVAEAMASAKLQIAEEEGMLEELLRLVTDEEGEKPADPRAVEAGLAALVAASSPRRVRPRIVALGAVPALGRLLERPSTPAAAAGMALRLMEAASTCTEGRAAICGDPASVTAVVGRMGRAPAQAPEAAVAVLWSVCCLSRDRRAQEAAAAAGGLAKVLLLMQSNCSPAARQMGGDLLKVLKANCNGDLPSYDSKTSHITPF